MLKLTTAEIGYLRQLSEKSQTISGNKNASGLKRLIEAGYVIEKAITHGDTSRLDYEITAEGRAALKAADAPPVESTDKAGEAG
jgi:hypothetical protein